MAVMNINPTRMELARLKKRLKVARRGHKLMKDKRDELMKKFLELAVRCKDLREEVENAFAAYHQSFIKVQAETEPEMLEEALAFRRRDRMLEVTMNVVMSVAVPVFSIKSKEDVKFNIHQYGYAFTSSRLDDTQEQLTELLPLMLELAQTEKTVQNLAEEIEKTRRRVNALEHVMIPQLETTIRYITMKLEENERGNLTRLMKIKDMMLERAIRDARHEENGV